MCFSAEVWQDYREYVKQFGAIVDIATFAKLFYERRGNKWIKLTKGMELAFAHPKTDAEREIKDEIDGYNAEQALVVQKDLFNQTTRLNNAERSLKTKVTKKAQEDVRIATDKISKAKVKLDDLKRTDIKPRDSRIFPNVYCPVLIVENGKRIVRPMRYGCRPAGKPSNYDQKYPGTYNARRDNLEGFWKGQFGHTHGLMVATTFYENVDDGEGGNKVIQFTPRTGEPMLIACLWSHWTDPKGKEPDLYSFAAITDDPEPEVAEAGHDRTIINIKPEHVDAWLNPNPKDLATLYAIFDDKRHPFYEHRLAA